MQTEFFYVFYKDLLQIYIHKTYTKEAAQNLILDLKKYIKIEAPAVSQVIKTNEKNLLKEFSKFEKRHPLT